MRLSISPGNSKLGRSLPNISLPPCASCPTDAPCRTSCYALKSFRQYPNVRKAWNANLSAYNRAPEIYFHTIAEWIRSRRKPVKYFRFHVAGDCPTRTYMLDVIMLARRFPETRFLLFTKRYAWVESLLDSIDSTENLSVVLSMWPSYGDNELPLPRAWYRDADEPDARIPEDAIECPGSCETCGMCWSLRRIGRDVVFDKH